VEHRRQFVIARRPVEGWVRVELGNGYILSHCPRLRVRSGGGNWLLGHAFSADAGGAGVEDGLRTVAAAVDACGRVEFRETYAWAGRWVLVCGDVVAGDASNSLGLFYREAGGEFEISSSLAVLHRLAPGEVRPRRLFNHCGMNWNPPPETRLAGVRKLLPDQAIDLRAGAVRPVEKSRLRGAGGLSAEAAGEALLGALTSIWRGLKREFSRLHVTVTSGCDSRTLLAAACAAGVPADGVTLYHRRISRADAETPARLCAAVGRPHRFVPEGDWRADRARIYREHTFEDIDEADRYYLERDMFSWFGDGECLVRGATFSLGRRQFYKELTGLDWETVRRDPARLARRFGDFASIRAEAAQLRSWIAWRDRAAAIGPDPYGWIERFHIDQRLAGWGAAGEQGLDLLEGTSINPANCSLIWDLLLRVAPAEQGAGAAQLACMRHSGTGLAEAPVNAVLESVAERLQRRGRRIARRILVESMNAARTWGR
jgi:hypothetical protein